MNGIKKKLATGAAAVALAVGLSVAGAVSPASAASWILVPHGPYSGALACFAAQTNAERTGHVIVDPCHVSGGKSYFISKYWG